MVLIVISLLLFLMAALPSGYYFLLAAASIRPPKFLITKQPKNNFVIAIAAHNEDSVIQATVRKLLALDYPANLFSVHIVADYCSDNTAMTARHAGAVVHERNEGRRGGKGAALSWLFERVLTDDFDAVVIFDADTQVKGDFLRVMNARLVEGHQVIQGQHVISNPEKGWFPALTWAMFLIDNRFQNLGRYNLGWSSKHMGDSICFRADILRRFGWGEGLTEDYQLRQRLLLEGIKIAYEPAALGCGEAALTWAQARAQRARWLRGTHDANRTFYRRLLSEGFKRRDPALLDGALQARLPSYSTITVLSLFMLLIQLLTNLLVELVFPWWLIGSWTVLAVLLFIYPFLGLALEKAPLKAYAVILSGPYFIAWRNWLALKARYGRKPVMWVRTQHGEQKR